MTKVEFDIIKPNLYLHGDSIYFGLDPKDLIPISRDIDRIIEEQIGLLKVTEADLSFKKNGKQINTSEIYNSPLNQFLDCLEIDPSGTTSHYPRMFKLGYTISAQTIESSKDVSTWYSLKRELVNPNDTIDNWEKNAPTFKYDRIATIKAMQDKYNELDRKMPDNFAILDVFQGYLSYKDLKMVGSIYLDKIKSEDDSTIESCKSNLIDKLKEVDGPCLTFEVPSILSQIDFLYDISPKLIEKCGDVLVNPGEWINRLFKLDP